MSKPRAARAWSGEVESIFVREALLQEAIDGKVRCNACERRCTLIPGGFGWCRARQNRDGRLVTLIYGSISSLAANPIEKKPFYHFHPGTQALTAGSWSCNFGCPWCQNWDISKSPPPAKGDYVSPQHFIDSVARTGCQGTSISFNEPTLSLEWSVDVFRLAKQRGFYNTYVTNGYMTPEALALLRETSPINHVKPGLPPFLLLHGDADKTVPYQQSLNFQVKLQAKGVTCDLITIPGAPHRLTEWNQFDATYSDRMMVWLRKVLDDSKP